MQLQLLKTIRRDASSSSATSSLIQQVLRRKHSNQCFLGYCCHSTVSSNSQCHHQQQQQHVLQKHNFLTSNLSQNHYFIRQQQQTSDVYMNDNKSFTTRTYSTAPAEKSENSNNIESSFGLYRLLKEAEKNLLIEQRQIIQTCRHIASQVGSTSTTPDKNDNYSHYNVLMNSASFLEELKLDSSFSVVIAGEFNAGKSTLINALLGKKLLESGALPTTDSITIVANDQFIDDDSSNSESTSENKSKTPEIPMGVVLHTVSNVPLLKDLTLVDTPGTNSAWLDHTERTLRLLPAADLILFVTSADRPFSESEKSLLKGVQAYRKNIIVIVNKMDILDATGGNHGQEQKQDVVNFVTDHASELLGARPVVIPISARDALSAKLLDMNSTIGSGTSSSSSSSSSPSFDTNRLHQQSNVWHRSNFSTLESFLKDTLTSEAKLQSKLLNPLGVAEGVMNQCMELLQEEKKELQADLATLNLFQSQYDGWKRGIDADLANARNSMIDMVQTEGTQCEIFFNRLNYITIHTWTLFDPVRLNIEWNETKREISIGRKTNLEDDLLENVRETADFVTTRGRAQGQAVIEYLGKRPSMKNQSLVGSVTTTSKFEDIRKTFEEKMSIAVTNLKIVSSSSSQQQQKSTSKNKSGSVTSTLENDGIYTSLYRLVSLSVTLQASALGSGIAAATQIIDPVQGLTVMSSLAATGGIVYTLGISRIKNNYQRQWTNRSLQLQRALDDICSKEMDKVNRRILDGIAPYSRFVESEQERIDSLHEQCEGVSAAARNLRNRISKQLR